MAPATAAIVVRGFAPAERGRAIGIYSGVSLVFPALGPLIGGLLTDALSCRAVFFVNLPVGLAVQVLAHVRCPAVSP